MFEHAFVQLLVLLGATVAVVLLLQRLKVPSVLGYLLVGVMLGPHTVGPVVDALPLHWFAEFGIVFLLFTIGLNFSLPQIHALRHQVLGLGTAQVALTTAVIALIAWLLGLPWAAAFVVGAVFAQSSTTIISKQLGEQGEQDSRHGRLALAMSVFQDVTAVPLVVVIPVLGVVAGQGIVGTLGLAMAKAVLAFALVFFVGRWSLRPLFHRVAERRSGELFTLTVLFVCLLAAFVTSSLGLSMAFGAFLAGMMLGETEFRHQIESSVRPFRDVLLGVFFISVGMLFDPSSLPQIWHWAVLGMVLLLTVKIVLVMGLVRLYGIDRLSAWRTAILLGVGGEFGFALLAIALGAEAIASQPAQIALTSVLFSMLVAPFLIRYNHALALFFVGPVPGARDDAGPLADPQALEPLSGHVLICGYGRIGQGVGHALEAEGFRYVALDLDVHRVRDARTSGEPVYYGDAAEPAILDAVGLAQARLLVISHEGLESALRILRHVRDVRPDLPVMVRTRDESTADALRAAGATEVVPETLEASLMIALQALLILRVPMSRVMARLQEQRACRYRLLRGVHPGGDALDAGPLSPQPDRLHPVVIAEQSPVVGRALGEIELPGVMVTALVREGRRQLAPPADSRLCANDVVVLFGEAGDLQRAEQHLLG